jgi:hypothetical protein
MMDGAPLGWVIGQPETSTCVHGGGRWPRWRMYCVTGCQYVKHRNNVVGVATKLWSTCPRTTVAAWPDSKARKKKQAVEETPHKERDDWTTGRGYFPFSHFPMFPFIPRVSGLALLLRPRCVDLARCPTIHRPQASPYPTGAGPGANLRAPSGRRRGARQPIRFFSSPTASHAPHQPAPSGCRPSGERKPSTPASLHNRRSTDRLQDLYPRRRPPSQPNNSTNRLLHTQHARRCFAFPPPSTPSG